MLERIVVSLATLSLVFAAACGDDDDGQHDAAVQQDAATDAVSQTDAEAQQDAEVQQDAAATTVGCTGESPATPSAPGGCCNESADCDEGICITGWCAKSCTEDSDCPTTAPGPFQTGTTMRCNVSPPGFTGWCVPGSLQQCGSAGDAPCPADEICIAGWNEDTTGLSDAFAGICATKMTQAGVSAAGQSQVGHPNPWQYQCEAPTYQLTGWYSRKCSHACDPENPVDQCPTGMQCSETWAVATGSGIIAGAGVCTDAVCGRMEFTGDDQNDVRLAGLNSECPGGEVCAPTGQNGVDGNIITHHCFLSDPTLGQVGDDCEHADKFDQTCDNWIYCIQARAQYNPTGTFCANDEGCGADEVCVDNGALPSRCSPKPDPGACSEPCRSDADCPDIDGVPSLCTGNVFTLANGDDGYITYCLPWRFISEDAPVPCDTNADCNTDIGQGCVVIGSYNNSQHCLPHAEQDAAGADCSVNGVADCQMGEACVEDADAGTFLCTAIQAFGDPCDPTEPHRCVGGSCLDIEWTEDDNGTATNTFCGGWCLSNADCGASQVCDWYLRVENDPATNADDVADGHCRSMMVRSGAGCAAPGDCTNGDACDPSTGRCYTSTAAWGGACAEHSDCPMYGLCDTRVSGGMCYRPGCDPASGNAGCDSTGACSDALPIGMCLEDCTVTADCSRSAEGFTCQSGACVAP